MLKLYATSKSRQQDYNVKYKKGVFRDLLMIKQGIKLKLLAF